jgi:hypothetical protein
MGPLPVGARRVRRHYLAVLVSHPVIHRWACCLGRAACARRSIREAIVHAEERSRRTHRAQHIHFTDGFWRITESQ